MMFGTLECTARLAKAVTLFLGPEFHRAAKSAYSHRPINGILVFGRVPGLTSRLAWYEAMEVLREV